MLSILLNLLSRYWLHLLIAGLVGYAFKYTYDSGVNSERTRWETKAYQATIASHEAASKFTAGVMSAHREITDETEAKTDSHTADVSDADRLRQQLSAAIEKSAANSSRFAADSKAAQARYRVLADLYKESDRLAGIYADQADRNRIAGEACERSYSSLVELIRKTYGDK